MGERSLKIPNTIVTRNWEYVRFVDVDMVLCWRKNACKWTLRGRDNEKEMMCFKKKNLGQDRAEVPREEG